MKLSFRQRIFFYFFIVFALFTICIIVVEQRAEKKHRTENLVSKLDGFSDLIHSSIRIIAEEDTGMQSIQKLIDILPSDMRVSLIDLNGKVLYDKDLLVVKSAESHLNRPEIRSAQYQETGTNIRISTSTQQEYLYYAKKYDTYFIRVALPYNVQTKALLKPDNLFIYITLALFVGVLILLNYLAGGFSKSITELKRFARLVKEDKAIPESIDFPDDELGEISAELVQIVNQKEKVKKDVELEKEKLIRHFKFAEEGLALFSAKYEKTFVNTHFIRFVNFLVDQPILNVDHIFELPVFAPITEYLKLEKKEQKHQSIQINKNGKIFQLNTIAYQDGSFEITIKDTTTLEQNRMLKQEITSNIAHELRTPVTSLRGYLETLHENNVPPDKQKQFIDKALQQSIRLSNLIDDVSLISKIEDSNSQFKKEEVNLFQVINEVRIDLMDKIVANKIQLTVDVDRDINLKGNYTLLCSIFSNLIDNTINYTTPGVEIHIASHSQANDFVYLSYYDTGEGVAEVHLNRLFERFYRIDEGRTRNSGGSGLGLSIVRNAVRFHGGIIDAKNRVNGGLEYLFTLKK